MRHIGVCLFSALAACAGSAGPTDRGTVEAAPSTNAAVAVQPAPAGETRRVQIALVPGDEEPVEPLPTPAEVFESLGVEANQERIDLGRALFHDPRLSHDDTLSCASCHDLRHGGVDRRPTAVGIRGQVGPVNTPTVFNAALAVAQFWDGRAKTLEEQAAGPPQAAGEMGSSFGEIVAKLQQDDRYEAAFREAFPDLVRTRDDITADRILEAIAHFEATLVTPGSRFDNWLRGDSGALTQDELTGYALFKEVGCAQCHYGPAVGGKTFQRLGQKNDFFRGRAHTASDLGRYNVTRDERDRHSFKVPSLRNVELTAPYLHDGSVATLEEAVASMAHYQLGIELTQTEIGQIVAFLRTLTGTYDGRPLKAE
jgi:cytochrome c peroxidase